MRFRQKPKLRLGTLEFLAERFGPSRAPGAEITQRHKDIAAGLQLVLQASLLHILKHFKRETSQKNLCMAGGVALNCTVNAVIKRSRMFKNLFIQPAAGDDGSALGAALYVQRTHGACSGPRRMRLPLWGPSFNDSTIQCALDKKHIRIGCFITLF